ncbi:AzlC family ABC transporter permease [Pseudomonas sp. BE134]|uniref:AzlC family ABC transporter permease n=1 Tax=Pseudomonas sp. BE134 TaxID=2817843 RepID=UPI002855AFFD|nr:AzlC family ABC transporter permease [Pseudomonas sp. BE134]MDR6925910.1 putative branched-subunit amino acid permease [Pseudomonas sp. BE134]
MQYRTKMEAFLGGVWTLTPLIPGVIPFGLVTGVMAIEMGVSPGTTMGMTLLFYSGSAQMNTFTAVSMSESHCDFCCSPNLYKDQQMKAAKLG